MSIGRIYPSPAFIKSISEKDLIVEAALRRGEAVSKLIKPVSPSLYRIDLDQWKSGYLMATNVYNPNRNLLYNVFDNVAIDNTLSSITGQRIMDVQQAKFNFLDEKGVPDEECKRLFDRMWFLDFIKFGLTSIFEGPVLIEIFDFKENGEVDKISRVNRRHVKPELGIVTVYENEMVGIDYLTGSTSLYYIQVGDSKDLGLMYKIEPNVLAKKFAIAQWGEYDEKLGIPFRTVRSNSTDKNRHQQLAIIMEALGSAGWAVLNEDEKVELLQANGTDPTKCFDGLINLLTSEYTMLVSGQAATANSQNNKGTYGSLKALMEISDVIHAFDLTTLQFLINDVLIPRLIQYSPIYAPLGNRRFKWDTSIDLGIKELVDYCVALKTAGYTVDPEFITQKTGIPITKVEEGQPSNDQTSSDSKKKSLQNKAQLGGFYANKCCNGSASVNAPDPPSFTEAVLKVANLMFDGKQKGALDPAILKTTADYLLKGILSGYKTVTEDSDLIDINMLRSLKENVYYFSGFKTYDTLRAITDLLTDGEGKVRPRPEFIKEVLKVDSTYNKTYLTTEFDNAVVSSQQASQWVDIQKTKNDLPLLRFVATNDRRTTQICKALDGMTLPADSPVWDDYFLPLHFHERSHIEQLATGAITDMNTISLPDLQPMFKNNVGKTGEAFPESHPYYNVSQAAKKKIDKEVKKEMPDNL